MSRTNRTDLKKVEPNGVDFLTQYTKQDHSLDGMDEYRILPILKIVQPTTDQALKEAVGEGNVILRPGDAQVWTKGDTPFDLVAQFFWVEYSKDRDLNDKEGPMTIECTYDPTSEIAKRALDSERRFEVYEGHEGKPESQQWKYRYVRHFRFACVIYGDHELRNTPIILSFERGEDKQGQNFISAIRLRKQKVDGKLVAIPLWAQVWSFRAGFRDLGSKKWYGFDFIAATPAIIEPEDAPIMYEAHMELMELHKKNRIVVDDKGSEDTEGKPEDTSDEKEF